MSGPLVMQLLFWGEGAFTKLDFNDTVDVYARSIIFFLFFNKQYTDQEELLNV